MLELSLLIAIFAATIACVPLGFTSFGYILPRSKKSVPQTNPIAGAPDSPEALGLFHSNTKASFAKLRRRDPTKSRMVEIVQIVNETPDTVSLYFRPCGHPKEGPEPSHAQASETSQLPTFKPGQHIVFHRPATCNQPAERRCYSLSNAPNDALWRITVKDALSPTRPNGDSRAENKIAINRDNDASVSNWIHRHAREGDSFFVSGPQGRFTLELANDKHPVLFVAAGVGITPLASMIYHELQFRRSREKWLFYQVANLDNAPLLAELAKVMDTSRSIRGVIACSRDSKLRQESIYSSAKPIHFTGGKLQPASMIASVGTTELTVLMCGPTPWMESMKAGFIASGVAASNVHYESFGAALEATGNTSPRIGDPVPDHAVNSKPNVSFQVEFETSGTQSTFDGSKPDLLSHAKSVGVELSSGCRSGNCGACVVRLLKGNVDYTTPPECSVEPGEILPCVCIPKSDLVIQA